MRKLECLVYYIGKCGLSDLELDRVVPGTDIDELMETILGEIQGRRPADVDIESYAAFLRLVQNRSLHATDASLRSINMRLARVPEAFVDGTGNR